jgi:hypothetical protein
MSQKSSDPAAKAPAESVVRDIRRATRSTTSKPHNLNHQMGRSLR